MRWLVAVPLAVTWLVATPSVPGHTSAAMVVWTADDTTRISGTAPPGSTSSVRVGGARNEYDSFQLMVRARGGSLAGVSPTPSPLTGPRGARIPVSAYHLYREAYQDVTRPSDRAGIRGRWPDGLVPIGRDPIMGEQRNGAPFKVAAGENQGVWVDLHIPAQQRPGTYTGVISLSAEGGARARVFVQLSVWNFAIPSRSSLPTAFGFDTWDAYRGVYGQNWDTNRIVNMTNRYVKAAQQMRIALYGIDVSAPDYRYDDRTHTISALDWSLWDRTAVPAMDAPGHSFVAGALPVPDHLSDLQHDHNAEDVAYWKAVARYFARRGWLSRSYLYFDDEPSSADDYKLALLHARLLHRGDRRLRYLLTTAYRRDLVGAVNIWVPIINELDSRGYPSPSVYHRRQRAGDQVWWYDSDSSADDGQWPDMFIDHSAMNQRVMGWMTWRYGLDGFLYYDTVYAYPRRNPWTGVYDFGTNGDGTLFYPGKPSIIGGATEIPCFSMRLMLIRQSLQDYEYMRLLKLSGHGSVANAAVASVVTSSNRFSHRSAVLQKARNAMGQELSSLKRKPAVSH